MPDKIAYTPAEFAALFGKERTWGYRQIYAGKVDTVTIFGSIMIPAEEVEKAMGSASRYGVTGNTVKRRTPKKKATKRKEAKDAKNAWKKYLSLQQQGRKSAPISKSANSPLQRMTRGYQQGSFIMRRLTRKEII